jgi:5-methylcytosine-specific restriction enzyme A
VATWPYNQPAWLAVRPVILERDRYRCQIRGPKCIRRATHVDHIIPWAEGGAPFDPRNLRAACEPCNIGRAAARRAAMAKLNRQPASAPSRDW